MIIVEIKSKKQLREAPLLDLIDLNNVNNSKGKKIKYIGSAGMKKNPEQFKNVTVEFYKNTKQNLVIVIPNRDLLSTLSLELRDNGILQNSKLFPITAVPTLEEIIKNKGLDPQDIHVLIPLSSPIKGDYDDPIWAMVHDLIGHSLSEEGALNPKKVFGENGPISNLIKSLRSGASFEEEDRVLKLLGRALYAGVSEKFQVSGTRADDDIENVLFSIESNDDRWADILASIALKDFELRKSLDFLKAVEGEEKLMDPLRDLLDYLIITVEEHTEWNPGYVQYLVPW